MAVIDDRGRLFGKVNLIDAMVGFVVLLLIPLAYGAFLLFRVPVPTVAAIQPSRVVEHEPATLQVTGQNFRPFLRAWFGTTESNGFLVQSPTLAEIKLPDLTAGTYDLTLSDEGQELLRMPGALTVTPEDTDSGLQKTTARVGIQFVVRPQVFELVKVGDEDIDPDAAVSAPGRGPADTPRVALLTAVGSQRELLRAQTGVNDGLGFNPYSVDQTVTAFNATLDVPVELTKTGWFYKKRPVKVGGAFVFETTMYVMAGWIVAIDLDAAH